MKTTRDIINAIEMDVKIPRRVGVTGGPNWGEATYEGLRSILERHIEPLVKRIAELEQQLEEARKRD